MVGSSQPEPGARQGMPQAPRPIAGPLAACAGSGAAELGLGVNRGRAHRQVLALWLLLPLLVAHELVVHERVARQRPPARHPGAGALAARLEREYGGGAALAALPVWRRKFLWFPADGSARPPYYGSWSRASAAVTGRRPLARDALMEYELMSDQEWEEEPEGEDLSVRNALPSP